MTSNKKTACVGKKFIYFFKDNLIEEKKLKKKTRKQLTLNIAIAMLCYAGYATHFPSVHICKKYSSIEMLNNEFDYII